MERRAIGEQENKGDLNSTTKYRNDLSERDKTSFLNHPGYLSLANWKGPLCPSSTVLTSQNPLAKKKHGRLLYLLVQQAAENMKSHLSDQGIGSGQALSLSRPDSVLLN